MLRSARYVVFVTALALAGAAAAVSQPSGDRSAGNPWIKLDAIAQEAVDAGETPGVVLLVGHRDRIVYRKAFGARQLKPTRETMTPDTVFDLASLTKVIATTSSVMSLVEDGKIRLRDPVVKYWPEFGQHGKDKITIRQLLTHTSGLGPWLNFEKQFNNPKGGPLQEHTDKALNAIATVELTNPPDTKFVYSDLGFITLGEIVQRVSGKRIDAYARERIFKPLGMNETTYAPGDDLKPRIAPTTVRNGVPLRGFVHDGNTAMMGGIAGHAGLYSTADDLARYAKMLLGQRLPNGAHAPLRPATIRAMTLPHSPAGLPMRGLGWDIDSPYSHVRGDLMPLGSFGHTGFTGTYIWVDPYSQTYIIGLSNRVHPNDRGNVLSLWARAANIVTGIIPSSELPPRLPLHPFLLHPPLPEPAGQGR